MRIHNTSSSAFIRLLLISVCQFLLLPASSFASSLTVTSPNGGESWQAGTPHNITWTSANVTGAIQIQPYLNGVAQANINPTAPNTGSYSWSIPSNYTLGSTYKIALSAMSGTVSDFSDGNFSITAPPRLTVTSPNGGESWQAGTPHNITWTSANVTGAIQIQPYLNGVAQANINPTAPNTGSYSWSIPSNYTLGSTYKIALSAMSGTVSDFSDGNFSITAPPRLTVTSPNGGESWQAGTPHNITWTSANVTGAIQIQPYLNGVAQANINPTAPNTGSYSWSIPSNYTLGSTYKIALSAMSGTVSDFSDGNFSITAPPTLTVTSPNGGESWQAGTPHNITWTSANVTGAIQIQPYLNGVAQANINPTAPNTGSYSRSIPTNYTPGSTYKIALSAMSGTVSDFSDGNFSITAPPTLTVTSPNGGESWQAGTTHNITWASSNVIGTIQIQPYSNNVSQANIAAAAPNTGSYSWTIPTNYTPGSTYKIALSAMSGTVSDYSDGNFSITAPPTLTVTSPNGGESWQAGTTHNITWASSNVIGTIQIQPYSNNVSQANIAAAAPNTGSYSWTIPTNYPPGSTYKMSLSAMSGAIWDFSDANFTITVPPSFSDGFDYPIGARTRYTEARDGDGWYCAQEFGDLYAPGQYHLGEDWNAESGGDTDCGLLVYAVGSGTIVYANIATGWGRVLIVRHSVPDGSQVESLYGHLGSFTRTSGDVARGEQVGTIGNGSEGGTTYPCHLHLEVRVAACPNWGQPGPGYSASPRPAGWVDPSDFIDAHRPQNTPTLTVTSPNGGESWQAGTTHNITWTSTNVTGTIQIQPYLNGVAQTNINPAAPNTGTYSWSIPTNYPPGSTYGISLSAMTGTVWDFSDANFNIAPPPTLTVTSPNGGESWQAGTTHDITWTSTNVTGTIQIQPYLNGVAQTNINPAAPNTGSFSWIIPTNYPPASTYKMSLSAMSGTVYDYSDGNFSITPAGSGRPTAPLISSLGFSGGAFALSVGTECGFRYVLEFKTSLSDPTWTPVATNSGNGGAITLTDAQPVAPSRFYRVRAQ